MRRRRRMGEEKEEVCMRRGGGNRETQLFVKNLFVCRQVPMLLVSLHVFFSSLTPRYSVPLVFLFSFK